MRSAILPGLLVLAGCDGAPPPKDAEENLVGTVSGTDLLPASNAPAPQSPASVPEQHFQALGTEPFWSFDVQRDRLLYTSPEQPTPVAIAAHLEGMGKNGDGGLAYRGRMEGRSLTLEIRRGQCSDGMSDTVYPYIASFTWGDATHRGCARPK